MTKNVAFALLLCLFAPIVMYSQQLKTLTQGTATSIRGLSVVTEKILWASGSKGMVGRSTDGGEHWSWIQVPGFEKRDFRDIEAFDSSNALILAIAEPGVILRTVDGGKSWKSVYTDTTAGIFLDAFHFASDGSGSVIGDPIQGRIYIATTRDNGKTWKRETNSPMADSGEACFASSGTNIFTVAGGAYYFATGGLSSRFHTPRSVFKLPLLHGRESTGANSMDLSRKRAVIVGGDFASDTVATGNCVLVDLSGNPSFSIPATPPHGYRSCVIYMNDLNLITCGTSGVDISSDGGKNWRLISKESFHVCQKAKKGNAVFLAGGNGRIARLITN